MSSNLQQKTNQEMKQNAKQDFQQESKQSTQSISQSMKRGVVLRVEKYRLTLLSTAILCGLTACNQTNIEPLQGSEKEVHTELLEQEMMADRQVSQQLQKQSRMQSKQ
ncbi:hypothetical protein [Psychromonas sp. SR45-3]|uniref:hypothetical protein n=1 Tax=Psychromonas sp. SR45-3 TaxID=2760930 RepID=UPI0015F96A72|nr:hypothetical protein [Psychromonas sp. SR45-3]MBB1273243.1 hypothetical protein [Psychromonas sp. SR45-3]